MHHHHLVNRHSPPVTGVIAFWTTFSDIRFNPRCNFCRVNPDIDQSFGTDFGGYSPGAAWEDFKLGTGNLMNWERCAVVTDREAIAGALRVFSVLMPGEVRAFPIGQTADALRWAAEG